MLKSDPTKKWLPLLNEILTYLEVTVNKIQLLSIGLVLSLPLHGSLLGCSVAKEGTHSTREPNLPPIYSLALHPAPFGLS